MNMGRETKQILIVRHDLKCRTGKIASQCAHASIAFLLARLTPGKHERTYTVSLSKAEQSWLDSGTTKITVRVESEQELLDIYQKALEAGIEAHLITDAGRTEFHGEHVKTCVALGPDYADRLDPITGNLQLY